MEAKWYKSRKCYRVWIPARLSENGKACRRFFNTKTEAEKVHFRHEAKGLGGLGGTSSGGKACVGGIRQSQKYGLLLEAWRRFEEEGDGEIGNLTVHELAEKFLARQRAERRSARTVLDDRWRLNAMTRALGHLRAGAVKRADILGYMEGIPPGTNRRSHYKTLRKLWRWAFHLEHVAKDPMGTLRPLDNWGVNNEVLSTELFQRLLRFARGLEAPREGDIHGLRSFRRR